ncbi:MAG: hypothetical protein OXC14_16375, partial [Rhodospirillaceae bacterium]|nr:hypothetical protein [Rhodospirillaceae bacterium]
MPDKELPPDFAEAMPAHANSDSPRHEWKSQPGFNTVSLGAWLDVCKTAGVEAVPATDIGKIEIAHLIVAIDNPESTEENQATRALRAFWTKIEAAKKPGTMIRWDCCTCSEVKHRLDTGRAEWHQ